MVANPFSRGSSWPRDGSWVSYIAGEFFIIWATRKAPMFFNASTNIEYGIKLIYFTNLFLSIKKINRICLYHWFIKPIINCLGHILQVNIININRNGMDLTEAEDIKKRWQEYAEELYKKDTTERLIWSDLTYIWQELLATTYVSAFLLISDLKQF